MNIQMGSNLRKVDKLTEELNKTKKGKNKI